MRKLVRLMIRADLTELEIDDSNQGLRVHLKRPDTKGGDSVVQPVVHVVGGGGPGGPHPAEPGAATTAAAGSGEREVPPGTDTFASPMVGTFYRSASPDAEPFVEVGSRVTEDSVLCIVEAMKVMNEIKAEMRGEIVEILVENGEPVEFGQALFLIKRT